MIFSALNNEVVDFLFQRGSLMEQNIKGRCYIGKFAAQALEVSESVCCSRSFEENISGNYKFPASAFGV